jgi:hypothetical protein
MNPSGWCGQVAVQALRLILVAILAATGMGADCEAPLPPAVVPATTRQCQRHPRQHERPAGVADQCPVVNVGWQAGDYPVDPTSFNYVRRALGERLRVLVAPAAVNATTTAGGRSPSSRRVPGRSDYVADAGQLPYAELAVAVRAPGAGPDRTGQKIWLDFESDRDATPGPDFPVDLQAFGLGNAAAPVESG